MQGAIRETANLSVIEGEADDLIVANGRVAGVRLTDGRELAAGAVVLTTGTFLRGLIHIGEKNAGRPGRRSARGRTFGHVRAARLCARTAQDRHAAAARRPTIDWAAVEMQPGDEPPEPFSTLTDRIETPQIQCGITRTTPATHDSSGPMSIARRCIPARSRAAVRAIAPRSRTRSSASASATAIRSSSSRKGSTTPRSIRTASRPRCRRTCSCAAGDHPRAGAGADRPAGLRHRIRPRRSARAQADAGDQASAGSVPGRPDQRHDRLRGGRGPGPGGRPQRGAGDRRRRPIVFDRAEGYLGVMIDDLVTRGVTEPYRMFTSRAEYRLTLRADNADQRLTDKGIAIGCVGPARRSGIATKMAALAAAKALAKSLSITPNEAAKHGISLNKDGQRRTAFELLSYPDLGLAEVARHLAAARPSSSHRRTSRDRRQIRCLSRAPDRRRRRLPARRGAGSHRHRLCRVPGLSNEVRPKLEAARPRTVGQAGRLDGMTPAALGILAAYLRREARRKTSKATRKI